MNKIFTTALLVSAFAFPAVAQTNAAEHSAHHPGAASAAAVPNNDLTEGEVRRIDKANGKITLKHGEIKNLDMPGMTMVFQVKDAAMLDAVKVGDQVRFQVEKQGSALVVTTLQAAR